MAVGMLLALSLVLPTAAPQAQEMEPRAYSPSPVGFNVLILTDTYNTGDVAFDPSVPFTDVRANVNVAAVGYAGTFDFFGRSANVGIAVPYARGDVDGQYLGEYVAAHRSAYGDPRFRLAVNLYGAPAMTPKEFAAFRRQTIVGASLVVVPPLGDYDSTKLINVGSNRWAFKPEVGLSRTRGRWTLEVDVGAWFFTDNGNFWGGKLREQDPIVSLQLHAIYTIRPRMWVALDGTYYNGGRTTINGRQNYDLQQNARIGITLALPITRQQALKLSASSGARTSIGGNFQTVGIAYQYSWMDRQ